MRPLIAAIPLLLCVHNTVAAEWAPSAAIHDEIDVKDAVERGEISAVYGDELIRLLEDPVPLETATRRELLALPGIDTNDVDRFLEWRRDAEAQATVDEAVAAGVLTADQAEFLRPFVRDAPSSTAWADGSATIWTAWSAQDNRAPPASLLVQAAGRRFWEAGLAVDHAHDVLGHVYFDRTRQVLAAPRQPSRWSVPKAYGSWEGLTAHLLLGSFRAGWGLGLVFDNSGRRLPHGIEPDLSRRRSGEPRLRCRESDFDTGRNPCPGWTYGLPNLDWPETMFGIAATTSSAAANSHFVLAGFGSMQNRDVYQYMILDGDSCGTRTPMSGTCPAPDVIVAPQTPLGATTKWRYATLPNLVREQIGGGDFAWHGPRNMLVGMTAYGARQQWQVDGIELDWQPWAPFPPSGTFGAAGIRAGCLLEGHQILFEAAHTYDQSATGGGPGAVARYAWGNDSHAVESYVRAYGPGFANPFASPPAAADRVDGFRARDELGTLLRWSTRWQRWLSTRITLDVWRAVTTSNPGLDLNVQSTLSLDKQWELTTRADARNARPDPICTAALGPLDTSCANRTRSLSLRVGRFGRWWRWSVDGRHRWRLNSTQERDVGVTTELSFAHRRTWRLGGQVTWFDDNWADIERGAQGWRNRLFLRYRRPPGWFPGGNLRWDLWHFSDRRASTRLRQPNPFWWLWFELVWELRRNRG